MKESGYYATGTEFDPSAPWNEKRQREREFDVLVTQSLNKYDSIMSEDYIESLYKEEGLVESEIDTSFIDFEGSWKEQNFGIDKLLKELEQYVSNELASLPNVERKDRLRRQHLKEVLRACQGWELTETIVEEQ